MPGLIGLYMPDMDVCELDHNLTRMTNKANFDDRYKIERFISSEIGLARLDLGIFNNTIRATESNDKSKIVVFLFGEIFNCQELQFCLGTREDQNHSQNQLVAKLYSKYGEEFITLLNGSFIIAIWDGTQDKLLIFNDRFALRPLFYFSQNNKFVFSSQLISLLQNDFVKRDIDLEGLFDFFRFGYVLGDRTLLRGIKTLGPGSKMIINSGKTFIERYWQLPYGEPLHNMGVDEYVNELSRLWLQSIERQIAGEYRFTIPLSGGLDSRTVLASVKKVNPQISATSYTFGKKDCDDVRLAKIIADHLNIDHIHYNLTGDFICDFIEQGVEITNGLLNVIHMHGIQFAEHIKVYTDVVVHGYLGDAILGGSFLRKEFFGITDFGQMLDGLYEKLNYLWEEKELCGLLHNQFQKGIISIPKDNLKSELQAIATGDYLNNVDYFFMTNRPVKFTVNGLLWLNKVVEYRTPFYDNNLIDFVVKMPQSLRINSEIYKKLIIKLFPQIKDVPWQKTGYPIGTSKEIRIKNKLIRGLNNFAKNKILKYSFGRLEYNTPYEFIDYNREFRKNERLKNKVEKYILCKDSISKEFLNEDAFQKVWKRHLYGQGNYAENIGLVLTFEAFCNRFLKNN